MMQSLSRVIPHRSHEQMDAPPRVREGSPWRGLWVVVAKDMADHLTSARMRILEVLILLGF